VKASIRVRRKISDGELTLQRGADLAQERRDAHGRARALKKGLPARLFREAVERALTVADQPQPAQSRAAEGRCVNGVDGNGATLRFANCSFEIDALRRRSGIEAARQVQSVGDHDNGATPRRQSIEAAQCFDHLHIRVEWGSGRRADGNTQRARRAL